MMARKARGGTSWLDSAGQKRHPFTKETFFPSVHSDTRPPVPSHFLPLLSLEKLAFCPVPRLLTTMLCSWSGYAF